jgi:hypothetical protein
MDSTTRLFRSDRPCLQFLEETEKVQTYPDKHAQMPVRHCGGIRTLSNISRFLNRQVLSVIHDLQRPGLLASSGRFPFTSNWCTSYDLVPTRISTFHYHTMRLVSVSTKLNFVLC